MDECLLQVKVVPGASRTRVAGRYGEGIKVQVAAAPERGRANEAVIGVVAQWLSLKPAQVTIRSGHSQPRKQLRLLGLGAAKLAESIAAL
jgi:uncharacterized protein (TIGR00251 family)